MPFSAFFRFGLIAGAIAVASWAQTPTSTSCFAPGSASFGQPVKISATVSSTDGTMATGTVTFTDVGSPLGSAGLGNTATASLTTPFGLGTHFIICSYSGDATHAASVSSVILVTVVATDVSITLTASMNPAPVGQRVDIDVFVKAFDFVPNGFVTLFDGNNVLANLLLFPEDDSSRAQFSTSSLSGGTHVITASFGGDTFFNSANSAPLVLVVGRRSSKTAILSASPSPANAGQPVTFTVQVFSDLGVPTGSVTLLENAAAIGMGSLTTGTAVITVSSLAAGTHSIVASYGGDATFDVSASSPFSLQVNGAATTTQLTAAPNPVQVNQTVTLTATVTSASGIPSGTVAFQNGQTALGAVNLDATGHATLTTSFASPGAQSITASYNGSGQFAASASQPLTLTVNPRQLTITSASSLKTVVSPDSLASIFGDNLAANPVSAGPLPWPSMLGGVSVIFRDNTGMERAAALKFVSAMQINAVVPPDEPLGQATVIVRTTAGVDVESGTATIADVAPGLFSGDGTGTGAAAAEVEIVHPDGSTLLEQTFRCDSNGKCTTLSVDLGSDGDQAFLILFGTGIRRGLQSLIVRVAGQNLTPSSAGPQSQLGGVDQVNVLLPASLRGAGDVTVQVIIGDQPSNAVVLHFQ